ncbi:MAG: chemotaxis protein CheW [Polyangia bacterium]|jgi:chemotaxis signal transduction protein|nr:chemotaxis protein CheW [Polyangia bacterium]
MTRSQESTPRKPQEPAAPTGSSTSLLDDWDLLFEPGSTEPLAKAIEVEPSPPSTATRFLGFRVGSQLYAAPLAELSEVVREAEITPVPRVRPFIRGIVSVRGMIVPIVDLRRRLTLGMDAGAATLATTALVAEQGSDQAEDGQNGSVGPEPGCPDGDVRFKGSRAGSSQSGRRILITSFGGEYFGLLVDEVTHPFALENNEIEPPPVTLPRRLQDLVQGIGRVQDDIHILLDLSVVLRFDAVMTKRGRGEGGNE